MSFGLFSLTTVLVGIAALTAALWFAQWLRVQHREVEVVTTMFWEAALEETRARVFARRFRHWWAWLLLVIIASLLWMLVAQPQTTGFNSMRHVVLVDWSEKNPDRRGRDLDLALAHVRTLPDATREVIAVGSKLETLLRPGEPLDFARLRSQGEFGPGPRDLGWAIESLAARATENSPISVHVIGNTPIDTQQLKRILDHSNADANADSHPLHVYRIPGELTPPGIELATLGVSDALSRRWEYVDLWFSFLDNDDTVQPERIRFSHGGVPLQQDLITREDGLFEMRDVRASGATIEVTIDDQLVGAITLPERDLIRVQLKGDVPKTLRDLIELDPACQIVNATPHVIIGTSSDSHLRLTQSDEPTFVIQSDDEDPHAALTHLVDELALRQIDAQGIAEQSDRVVDVTFQSSDARSLSMWSSLFTAAFDFRESRSCPLIVSRAVRWLSNQDPTVEWAELGRRLPVSSPTFGRAIAKEATTSDGRLFRTTQLASPVDKAAELDRPESMSLVGLSPFTWLGSLAVVLLLTEWILFQRGRIP